MKRGMKLFGMAILAAPLAASAAEVGPTASLSYAFTGRIMNAHHEAFDTNMVATIEARDANGKLLACSRTFRREGSARNYALAIPVASAAASGFTVKDDALDIEVTDSKGIVWQGVIDSPTVGKPGAVREVDIVLANDANNDGLDDNFYRQLKARWQSSIYWVDGEDFDVAKDYDGDGISTLDEALTGTNPFNPNSKFGIISYERKVGTEDGGDGDGYSKLVFDTLAGHAYELEETDDLAAGSWSKTSFVVEDDGGDEVGVISEPTVPAASRRRTIYLAPKDGNPSCRFYRVKAR